MGHLVWDRGEAFRGFSPFNFEFLPLIVPLLLLLQETQLGPGSGLSADSVMNFAKDVNAFVHSSGEVRDAARELTIAVYEVRVTYTMLCTYSGLQEIITSSTTRLLLLLLLYSCKPLLTGVLLGVTVCWPSSESAPGGHTTT